MEFTCDLESFRESWTLASRVVPANPPVPVLGSVLLTVEGGPVTLRATSFALGIRRTLGDASVTRPGTVLLPKETVGAVIESAAGDTLSLSLDGTTLAIRSGRARWTVETGDPGLFPDVPGFAAGSYHTLTSDAFRRAVRRTAYAADSDNTRYTLGGVAVVPAPASLELVATDGRRLAVQREDASFVGEWSGPTCSSVVPEKACRMLAAMVPEGETLDVALDANAARFRWAGTEVSARLLEGRFPPWRDILRARSGHSLVIDVVALRACVEQAAVCRSEATGGIDLIFSGGTLRASAARAGVGGAEVEMVSAWEGDEFAVELSAGYLLDLLRPLAGDVTIGLETAKDGVEFRTGDGFAGVIMPLTRE